MSGQHRPDISQDSGLAWCALVTTRLAELETVIERGMQTFIEELEMLMEIRGAALDRQTDRHL